MKYISFRTFLICILMPPALYLFTLHGLELVFQKKMLTDLQKLLFSDSRSLLEGQISIVDETRTKINAYKDSDILLKLGFTSDIIVKTKVGRLIYPQSSIGKTDFLGPGSAESNTDLSLHRFRIAEENWRIIQEGLQLIVLLKVPRNSWLANGILTFYIMLFVILPYRAYLAKNREAQKIEISKRQALEAANKKLTDAQKRLDHVSKTERNQQKEIRRLKTDLDLAGHKVRETEDEALAEMEALDKSLSESIKLREQLEVEVIRLEEELNSIDGSQKISPPKQQKQLDIAMKRFRTLYKNLEIHQRASEGFLNLENPMQLHAEELIHALNDEPGNVPIKRKVFTKKGNIPIFECAFARKGRVYWGAGPGNKKQIFVIGTKNSQHRDLTYLDGL